MINLFAFVFAVVMAIASQSTLEASDKACVQALKAYVIQTDRSESAVTGAASLIGYARQPSRGLFRSIRQRSQLPAESYQLLKTLEAKLRQERDGKATGLPFKFSELYPDLKELLVAADEHISRLQSDLDQLISRESDLSAVVAGESKGEAIPVNMIRGSEFDVPVPLDLGPSSAEAHLVKNRRDQARALEIIESEQAMKEIVYAQIWNRFLKDLSSNRAYQKMQANDRAREEQARLEEQAARLDAEEAARSRVAEITSLRPHYDRALLDLNRVDPTAAESIRMLTGKLAISDSLNRMTIDEHRHALRSVYEYLAMNVPRDTSDIAFEDAFIFYTLYGTFNHSPPSGDPAKAYVVPDAVREAFQAVTDTVRFHFDTVTEDSLSSLPSNFADILRMYPTHRVTNRDDRRVVDGYLQKLFKTARIQNFSADDSVKLVSDYLAQRFKVGKGAEMESLVYRATYGRVSRYPLRALGYMTKQTLRAAAVVGLGAGLVWAAPHLSDWGYQTNKLPYTMPEAEAREKIDSLIDTAGQWSLDAYGQRAIDEWNRAQNTITQRIEELRSQP